MHAGGVGLQLHTPAVSPSRSPAHWPCTGYVVPHAQTVPTGSVSDCSRTPKAYILNNVTEVAMNYSTTMVSLY